MKSVISSIFNRNKPQRLSPRDRARIAFEVRAKDQFKKLKDKGLSITVFSL